MEIIKEFGVDPLLLTAQIVNFLIILFILKKFVFKPVLDILKKRENEIKDGLRAAQKGQEKLEEAEEKERGILKNAQIEAGKLIEDAKLQAIEVSKKIEEKTRKETEDMVLNAKEQIQRETRLAEKELSLSVGKAAIEFLEKSMKDIFGDEKQKELMQIAIKKIKTTN
ncbi:MAG: F0F1 ATP synthase subunit B [Patescibacteria group bacterium]